MELANFGVHSLRNVSGDPTYQDCHFGLKYNKKKYIQDLSMISKTAISRETDRTQCRALLFALTVKTVTCIRLMVVTAFFFSNFAYYHYILLL